MSLTKAKQLYTRRKNALNRLLDPIPTWLQDQSLSVVKLEELKKQCDAAWEEFNTSYDKLFDIQSEHEAQEADMEDRDQEFGNLETEFQNLKRSLAEAIDLRGRDRDAQQLQQEKHAEAEQLQQEKRDQVTVHRLRLTSLYKGAKDKLSVEYHFASGSKSLM